MPKIGGCLPEPEVFGEMLDVRNHAVDVDVADLEENAHRLRQTVPFASLQELGAGQRSNVRVTAAIDEDLTPRALATRLVLDQESRETDPVDDRRHYPCMQQEADPCLSRHLQAHHLQLFGIVRRHK